MVRERARREGRDLHRLAVGLGDSPTTAGGGGSWSMSMVDGLIIAAAMSSVTTRLTTWFTRPSGGRRGDHTHPLCH